MDPSTLLGILSAIIKLLHSQRELFSRLEVNSRHSLKHFRFMSEALRSDLSLYSTLFQAYFHRGSGPTFSEVFNTEKARNAFDRLTVEISSMNRTLPQVESAVADRAKRAPVRDAVNMLKASFRKDEIERNTEFIEERASQLAAYRVRIAQTFKLFHSFYLLYDTSQIAQLRQDYKTRHRHGQAIDYMVWSFSHCPFGVQPNKKGEQFCSLNKDWETAEKCIKVMTNAGKAWVEDQLLDKETVTILGLLQTRLMELVWSCSLEQLRTEFQLDDRGDEAPSDIIQDGQLLEESLKGSIARAHDQKFSIAFCGVVKAGYREVLFCYLTLSNFSGNPCF
jgi:hypothetical protein